MAANFWRRGAVLIGIGVGVAAALRLVLSEDKAGLLVVRTKTHRLRDDGLGGASVLFTAWTIDPLGTS